MQRHAQRISEKQITPDGEPAFRLGSESALRAAYMRLELSHFYTFEHAMSEPAYAMGIRNLADAMARRELPERIAAACANDHLNYRLQFTEAFRAELRAAISAREQEAIDAA